MTDTNKYWLEQIVDQIEQLYPSGEIKIASGHSPSGNYHIGLIREHVIASAITSTLQRRGRNARHLDFVDDFDALRKIPENLDPSFSRHMGKPLYLVPSPDGKGTYADFFLQKLIENNKRSGIEPEIIRASEIYPKGIFTEAIEASLEKLDDVVEIIERVSNRQLPKDWAPVQILSDADNLREWDYTGWDKSSKTVEYRDKSGEEGTVSYAEGRVKLDWRLDWPARWATWGVTVEPFGRDHAAAGGSYDTGKELVEKIFNAKAPFPIPYDFINIQGQTKKMSKSSGNVIALGDVLKVMPAEIIRYFVLRSLPKKTLFFDLGLGLYNLIDEYSQVEEAQNQGQPHQFSDAHDIAQENLNERSLVPIRFNHLVTTWQATLGNFDKFCEALSRTGYEEVVRQYSEPLRRESEYIDNWLRNYAPDEVKFTIQDTLPKSDLKSEQRQLLKELAVWAESEKTIDAQTIHARIHEIRERLGLEPSEAFAALYQVILGQISGPKAGFFLSILDKTWLVQRLEEASSTTEG